MIRVYSRNSQQKNATSLMLEQDTQTRQRELRKELGLRNLVLSQILNIVGLFWIGTAAKLGPSNVSFWMLGIFLFYLPSAAVVIYLNRAHMLEGGLYEWSRLGFNELVGFLVAWNLWLNAVAILSYGGIQSTVILSYVLGPRAAWIVDSRWVLGGVTLLILSSLIVIALIGMGLSKKVQDFGGAVIVIVFAALIALPLRNHLIGRPTHAAPFTLALPVISLFSLNVLGKMSFGAFGGFDSMAIFAGECRDATKAIGRSVIIATPIIALMFVLGTSSVVSLVPKDKIDLISPISQALTLGTRPTDPGANLIPLVIGALLVSFVAQLAISFAITTRLPLVAGWDNLLPAWFGRLHPRRKTPTNAILFVGTVALAMAIAGVAGAGQQEAFQLLLSAAGIFYALAYMVMFALPLFGRQREALKPALWLQAAAMSGFIMTAMFLVLSLFPIINVPRPLVFTVKIGGFVLACQLGAAALFYSYRRRSRACLGADLGSDNVEVIKDATGATTVR
jgi:amino acid transporter